MNPWQILGIEPTKDKKTIKKAYAKLVKLYHPEENPEEFKQIQEAFQLCMQDQKMKEEKIVEEIKTNVLKGDRVETEKDIIPPKIPIVSTLFTEEKDVMAYQMILESIDQQLPVKIEKKDILSLFSNPNIMPYLEDESFCSMLENILLKRKVGYIKNRNDPVFMYLSKYHMEQLRKAMDYNLVPFYRQTRFHIWLVIFVALLLMAFFE